MFPLAVWLIWRVLQGLVLALAGGDLVDDAFRFDGGWFLSVLEHGYVVTDTSYATQQNVAFFPGVVWLAEPFSWILGDKLAGVFIANSTSAAAFVAVYGAISCITHSELTARRSVIAMAVWPSSVVMTAFYSEGLFLTATATAIWADARSRHAMASVAAFVAGITRSVGFLIGPVMAVARCCRLRRLDSVAVVYALSGPAGLSLVAATQAVQVDDPLAFVKAQEGWDRSLSAPWVPIHGAVVDIIDKLPRPAMELGLNLASMLLVFGALVIITRRHRRASDLGFLGWGWVAWLAPLWTTVPSSQVRFALASWPALAAVGDSEARWLRRAGMGAASASICISVVLVRRWANGQFIG